MKIQDTVGRAAGLHKCSVNGIYYFLQDFIERLESEAWTGGWERVGDRHRQMKTLLCDKHCCLCSENLQKGLSLCWGKAS